MYARRIRDILTGDKWTPYLGYHYTIAALK